MYDTAAIDISTGHGFDSALREHRRDPWASDAVQIVVDMSVNHREVVYPHPSTAAAAADVDENLPEVFARARTKEWRLVRALPGKTAQTIAVPTTDIRAQFNAFTDWLTSEPDDLVRVRAWVFMHEEEARIAEAHVRTVPAHQVVEFLAGIPAQLIADGLGMSYRQLEYTFDVFVRGIQYNEICADAAPYFPHPLRARLRMANSATQFEQLSSWSWGGYVAALVAADPSFRDISRLLELIQSIRAETLRGATWYDIATLSPSDQIDRIENVAAAAALPARLKDDLQKFVERNLRAIGFLGPAAALIAGGPTLLGVSVGVLVAAGTYRLAEGSKDYLPGAASRLPILKGHLRWPGLQKGENRKSA
jgi:hypothetical protein